MILTEVFARFYKSFNYDFLRKNNEKSQQKPWEQVEGKWYPYVRISLEEDITTIVGANESGKSHLLTAIEKGITGIGINREDFCRYSHFYTVELGKRRWPDFGFKWTKLSDAERQIIATACGMETADLFHHFYFFRENKEVIRIFLPFGSEFKAFTLSLDNAKPIISILPQPFRINAQIALPSSVSIALLASPGGNDSLNEFTAFSRKNRIGLMKAIQTNRSHFATQATVTSSAAELSSQFLPFLSASNTSNSQHEAELGLARDLICKVANIDPESLIELSRAISEGLDGHVNGIVGNINKALKRTLNFPHWWVQDRAFSLRVDAREHELAFTIRDRTEQDYSFQERSSGLKYFLSYYVQYLAHVSNSPHGEILLMDEPDAYLSSQAQQDLLKVFDAFAHPENKASQPIQVAYVTHSPFLIDRNHSERIRVLEKGYGEEGTRVVRNASRNHYEPLRSALGAFVAETTFIGNCNLMVEGAADQVLLAGAATFLKYRGVTTFHTLDLNNLTIVPAGSASQVPYLVYLARGRDYEKPAVIVLLDSDEAGNNAKAVLLKSGPLKKLKLPESLILQIGDIASTLATIPSKVPQIVEIEDLIPFEIALAAVPIYFSEVTFSPDVDLIKLTGELVKSKMSKGKSIFDSLAAACTSVNPELHLDKIGFSRAVLKTVHDWSTKPELSVFIKEFEVAMSCLFTRLTQMQRQSLKEMGQERVTQRVNRAKKAFFQDHPQVARREEVAVLFEDIISVLDDEPESDDIRTFIERLSRQYKIKDDVTKPVEDFDVFKDQLARIEYADFILADVRGKGEIRSGSNLASGVDVNFSGVP